MIQYENSPHANHLQTIGHIVHTEQNHLIGTLSSVSYALALDFVSLSLGNDVKASTYLRKLQQRTIPTLHLRSACSSSRAIWSDRNSLG